MQGNNKPDILATIRMSIVYINRQHSRRINYNRR